MVLEGSSFVEKALSLLFGETYTCPFCGKEYKALKHVSDEDRCFECMYFDTNALWKEAEKLTVKVNLFDWDREIDRRDGRKI